jgi:hypothetical protein
MRALPSLAAASLVLGASAALAQEPPRAEPPQEPPRAEPAQEPLRAEPPLEPLRLEPRPQSDGPRVGFSVSRFQDDFGLGLEAATPSFANDSVRISASGGIAWYPHGIVGGDETWLRYGHASIRLEGGQRMPHLPIRLYGFGGPVFVISPANLSSTAVRVGGLGGFGFEFFFQRAPGRDMHMSYYLEAGGIGTGATADAVPGSPIFANGFLMATGFRLHLW